MNQSACQEKNGIPLFIAHARVAEIQDPVMALRSIERTCADVLYGRAPIEALWKPRFLSEFWKAKLQRERNTSIFNRIKLYFQGRNQRIKADTNHIRQFARREKIRRAR